MTNEVHVTPSQADAAKMIVERNSANGKPTSAAIRKIADAQQEPGPTSAYRRQAMVAMGRGKSRRLRVFLARMFSGNAATDARGRQR